MAIKYKHLETMRQVRLFITEVVVPLTTAGALLWSNDGVRESVQRVFSKPKATKTVTKGKDDYIYYNGKWHKVVVTDKVPNQR